jgi:hypothetical protein
MTRFRRSRPLAIACVACALGLAGALAELGVGGRLAGSDEKLPEGKAEVAARIDQEMKEGREKAGPGGGKPADPRSLRPTPTPDPRATVRGLGPVSPPFPSSVYLLDVTGWHGSSGARLKVVYAGALADDPTQGIVVVVTANRPPDNPSDNVGADQGLNMRSRVLRTPEKVGPVEIRSASGDVLTLVTSDGSRRFGFDAGSERFVES